MLSSKLPCLALVLALAACSGGGSTSAPAISPDTSNAAPSGVSDAARGTLALRSAATTESAFPNGVAWSIPGTIAIDNYDLGGAGVAYQTKHTLNPGGDYRQDGVGIQKTSDVQSGNGFDVGWNDNGDWYRYTVAVGQAARYNVAVRIASVPPAGGVPASFHLEDETGANLTGAVAVPVTGGFQTWTTLTTAASLTAGAHVIKFAIDSGNASFNLNTMTFFTGAAPTPSAGPSSAPSSVPSASPKSPLPSPLPSASPLPVPSASPLPNPSATPRALFHEFRTECDTDTQDQDGDKAAGLPAFIDAAQDPILSPGQVNPPMQHFHTFYGNRAISPTADVNALMASPSTCNMVGGHQAWWIPQASLDGVPIHPTSITMYYKMGPDGFNANITPFPNGIRILAGASAQTQAAFSQIGSWTCGNLPRTSDVPDSCAPGTDLVVRLDGPHCMADLTQTDSPTHRTHIVNSVPGPNGSQVCPTDHPIAVPMPVWKISYTVTGANLKSRLKFSFMNADGSVGPSGPAWSFHADEFFAFDPTRFAFLVNHCINGGLQCSSSGDGPHHTL